MKKVLGLAGIFLLLVGLASCGGGGGGASPAPPAYNMSGRWSIDMVTGSGSCPVSPNTHFPFSVDMTQAAGSNTVGILDTRDPGGNPGQATMSGNTISFSGPVVPEGGCVNATASVVLTVTSSTHFNGSGTYNCLDGAGCAVSVSYNGNKL